MLDITFELATLKTITDSKTKYNYVVEYLPLATATMIRDIIMSLDRTDPYQLLKSKVME